MPELPEIEIIRRTLAEKLVGHQVTAAVLPHRGKTTMHNEELLQAIPGQGLTGVSRYGKMIGLHFDGGLTLIAHLMLTGRVGLYDADRSDSDTAMLRLSFDDGQAFELVRVTARDIALLPTDQLDDYAPVKKLGPDALEITADEFAGNTLMTRGSVKDALLDQKVVAGIGNAYADEILYEARLSPFVKVKDAGEDGVDQVYRHIVPTLERAIEARAAGEYVFGLGKALGLSKKLDQMRVHNKEGEPCPNCGAPVKLVEKGGRGTFFCATCQPTAE